MNMFISFMTNPALTVAIN